MRPLLLSLGTVALLLGAVWAQSSGDNENTPQLPVGQTFKQFEFPVYQDGKLKSTLYAVQATGITLNRAETTDLKIDLYDNGAITTTITSPKADLYVNEQKMRTKNTVLIERADMEAKAQDCDFDLKTKKYVLRTHVKVTLKHFDVSLTPTNGPAAASNHASGQPGAATPGLMAPHPEPGQSMLDSPGAFSDTNAAPMPTQRSDTK